VSEEVNRKCHARNTTAKLSTTNADRERHVAQLHRVTRTDRPTDRQTDRWYQ